MARANRHVIQKTVFDVRFDSEDAAFEQQLALDDFVKRRLLVVIEETFDEAADTEHVLTLASVELDLGVLSHARYQEEMEERLRRQLREFLHNKKTLARLGSGDEASLASAASADLGHFEFYLTHGHLPWNAALDDGEALERLLERILSASPDRLESMLRQAVRGERVIRRLVTQFPARILAALFNALVPSRGSERLAALLADLQDRSRTPARPPRVEDALDKTVWASLLRRALFAERTPLDPDEIISQTLAELASSAAASAAEPPIPPAQGEPAGVASCDQARARLPGGDRGIQFDESTNAVARPAPPGNQPGLGGDTSSHAHDGTVRLEALPSAIGAPAAAPLAEKTAIAADGAVPDHQPAAQGIGAVAEVFAGSRSFSSSDAPKLLAALRGLSAAELHDMAESAPERALIAMVQALEPHSWAWLADFIERTAHVRAPAADAAAFGRLLWKKTFLHLARANGGFGPEAYLYALVESVGGGTRHAEILRFAVEEALAAIAGSAAATSASPVGKSRIGTRKGATHGDGGGDAQGYRRDAAIAVSGRGRHARPARGDLAPMSTVMAALRLGLAGRRERAARKAPDSQARRRVAYGHAEGRTKAAPLWDTAGHDAGTALQAADAEKHALLVEQGGDAVRALAIYDAIFQNARSGGAQGVIDELASQIDELARTSAHVLLRLFRELQLDASARIEIMRSLSAPALRSLVFAFVEIGQQTQGGAGAELMEAIGTHSSGAADRRRYYAAILDCLLTEQPIDLEEAASLHAGRPGRTALLDASEDAAAALPGTDGQTAEHRNMPGVEPPPPCYLLGVSQQGADESGSMFLGRVYRSAAGASRSAPPGTALRNGKVGRADDGSTAAGRGAYENGGQPSNIYRGGVSVQGKPGAPDARMSSEWEKLRDDDAAASTASAAKVGHSHGYHDLGFPFAAFDMFIADDKASSPVDARTLFYADDISERLAKNFWSGALRHRAEHMRRYFHDDAGPAFHLPLDIGALAFVSAGNIRDWSPAGSARRNFIGINEAGARFRQDAEQNPLWLAGLVKIDAQSVVEFVADVLDHMAFAGTLPAPLFGELLARVINVLAAPSVPGRSAGAALHFARVSPQEARRMAQKIAGHIAVDLIARRRRDSAAARVRIAGMAGVRGANSGVALRMFAQAEQAQLIGQLLRDDAARADLAGQLFNSDGRNGGERRSLRGSASAILPRAYSIAAPATQRSSARDAHGSFAARSEEGAANARQAGAGAAESSGRNTIGPGLAGADGGAMRTDEAENAHSQRAQRAATPSSSAELPYRRAARITPNSSSSVRGSEAERAAPNVPADPQADAPPPLSSGTDYLELGAPPAARLDDERSRPNDGITARSAARDVSTDFKADAGTGLLAGAGAFARDDADAGAGAADVADVADAVAAAPSPVGTAMRERASRTASAPPHVHAAHARHEPLSGDEIPGEPDTRSDRRMAGVDSQLAVTHFSSGEDTAGRGSNAELDRDRERNGLSAIADLAAASAHASVDASARARLGPAEIGAHHNADYEYAHAWFMQGRPPVSEALAALTRSLDRMLATQPETLRRLFADRPARAGFLAGVIDALPERQLAQLLKLLRPADHALLLLSSDVIANACCRADEDWRPRRVHVMKWRFIFTFVLEARTAFDLRRYARALAEHFGARAGKDSQPAFQAELCRRIAMNMLPSTQELARVILSALSERAAAPSAATAAAPVRRPSSSLKQPAPGRDRGAKIYIANAGVVLVVSYLPRLFAMLGLTEEAAFASAEAAERAVHLIQFIADERADAPEHQLVINKILCGVDPALPIAREIAISLRERELVDQLLLAVIAHWKGIGNTSVAGLRAAFLQRQGVLSRKGDAWQLQVENKAFDMLLDKLPWSYSPIKLPWMDSVIHVDWR